MSVHNKLYVKDELSANTVNATGIISSFNVKATDRVAIGTNAGITGQGDNSVAIGLNAGYTGQGDYSVAIGVNAGYTGQGGNSVAIGNTAGRIGQGSSSVAIGVIAGHTGQGVNSVAIGGGAGNIDQKKGAVAIGAIAGNTGQQAGAIAIGDSAGANNQQAGAIAIGSNTAQTTQGSNSIAIGTNAISGTQSNNTLVLNASGSGITIGDINRCYITPIRENATTANLFYDDVTNEVSYSFTVTESSIKLLSQNYIGGVGQDGNFSNTRQVGLPWSVGSTTPTIQAKGEFSNSSFVAQNIGVYGAGSTNCPSGYITLPVTGSYIIYCSVPIEHYTSGNRAVRLRIQKDTGTDFLNNSKVIANTFTTIFAQGASWTFNTGSTNNPCWGIAVNDLISASANDRIAFVIETGGNLSGSSQIGVGTQNNAAPFTAYIQLVGS